MPMPSCSLNTRSCRMDMPLYTKLLAPICIIKECRECGGGPGLISQYWASVLLNAHVLFVVFGHADLSGGPFIDRILWVPGLMCRLIRRHLQPSMYVIIGAHIRSCALA